MNPINFREIEKDIAKRTQEILNQNQQLIKYLTLDEKLRVVLDPDYQRQAVDLTTQANHLKKLNAADKNLLQRARELSIKYDLLIDHSGHN